MEQKIYDTYVAILENELKVALGCTEPIAIAYVGAKVREVLGKMPEHIDVYCSGNIVKNVKAVVVPNSDGQRGIDVAAALGVIGGDASLELAVLEICQTGRYPALQEITAGKFRYHPSGGRCGQSVRCHQSYGRRWICRGGSQRVPFEHHENREKRRGDFCKRGKEWPGGFQ